jgi:hypothetical protein
MANPQNYISPLADPGWDPDAPPAPIFKPGQRGSSIFAPMPEDPGPAPAVSQIAMSGGMPSVFANPPMPQVTRTPSPLENQISQTDQGLRKLQFQDANPLGSANNHPGFIGKALHIASKIGNAAGDIFAPATMELIPGTDANRQMKEGSLSQRLQALAQEQSQNEQRDQTTAGIPTEQADTHAKSEASTRLSNDQAGEIEDAPAPEPSLATAYAHAVNDALKNQRDPSQDPVVQHIADAITSLQKQPVTPPGTKTVQIERGGKPHQVLIDERTGNEVKDLGESGEKPASVNVNAGEAALDREAKQFGAAHAKSLDASQAQLEKIADARAMINGNAESQGLGIPKVLTALVGGQGTGVRITQAELTSIAHARGLSGDVEGTLNKLAGKGALSAEQQRQLTSILDDVKNRLVQKQAIAKEAVDNINSASTRSQIVAADKAARQKLSDMETAGGSIQVKAPDGSVHAFDSQAQADAFKKLAGIK